MVYKYHRAILPGRAVPSAQSPLVGRFGPGLYLRAARDS